MIRPALSDLEPRPVTGASASDDWTYDPETGQVNCEGGTVCTGVTWKPNGVAIAALPAMVDRLRRIADQNCSTVLDRSSRVGFIGICLPCLAREALEIAGLPEFAKAEGGAL